ncbi:hypothetical protein [Nonomuraea jabiensis]|uniref:Alpha-L-arabinofuranosidase n=1 Tax=Nonomuraea jabiensis TaxID=882448 RepID=A0A7W9GD17_9ACTN|nr:hypothetical protein [Nonomuraea jabiensis]MBB5781548.1 alpha-L-arabinofuranosidase [Nonomuraea jabiensis]
MAAHLAEVRSRILTADKLQDHNTPDAPGTVAPRIREQVTLIPADMGVHLPAHSFVTVEGCLA